MIEQLFLNDNDRLQLGGTELTSGDGVTVLVVDRDGKPQWVKTTVECRNGIYYLCGIKYSPAGLFAKR